MRFKIDWDSFIGGWKCTVSALFYFVFESNFRVQAPRPPGGGDYLEGPFKEGFFVIPVWGAYIWRGLYTEGLFFSEFYGIKRVKASLPVQVRRSKYLCFKSVERLFPADNTENLKNKGNYEFLRKDADFDTFTN